MFISFVGVLRTVLGFSGEADLERPGEAGAGRLLPRGGHQADSADG
jgi:hypothetical protein